MDSPRVSRVLDADAESLVEAIDGDLGLEHERWFDPTGYQSAALCLLDSIYSTGNHYSGVINLVGRYKERRREEGADASIDSVQDLIRAAESWGGVDGLIDVTNRWKTSTRKGAPSKASAVLEAADMLARHELVTIDDIRSALTDPHSQEHSEVKNEWLRIPGQRSGLTWNYFLMLAGVPGVKADRMIVRYVSRVLNREIAPKEAAGLVSRVADHLGIRRTKLDHAIWRKESGREVYADVVRS